MEVRRLWKRDSQYYPEYEGRSFTEPEHIRETVHIDLTNDGVAPLVTDHGDDTISIHDTVKWGSIILTKLQAAALLDKLKEKLYRGGTGL